MSIPFPDSSSARSQLRVSFNDHNEVQSIRVGAAEFATGGGDLWTAEFAASGDLSKRIAVRAGEAASFEREEDGVFLRLRWRDIPLGSERGVLNAVVEIENLPDSAQRWSLAFDNRSASWALFETSFPRLNCIMRDGEGDAMLPWKDHGARLFRARRAQPEPARFDYLGHFPMVAAFFIGETGLYVAAEDPELRLKSMVVEGEQCLRFVTPIENAGVPDKAAEGPRYAVTFAPLSGDWWEAARRYRAFALRQPRCAKGPIRERADFPRRACEVPLWINLHGSPDDIRSLLLRAHELFPEFPTGVHWHLWQHSGHDINYPEYFPEQPGTKEAIADCLAVGQEPMPYTNGRLWSADTLGYLAAEPYAVMRANGTRHVEKYAPWTPHLAVMCPTQRTWQRVVQRFAHRVFEEIGAKSIFLDQIGAAEGVPCFDPTHGHSVGGGSWWREGYREMLEPILRDAHAHGAYVATEGNGETAIGLADAFLSVVQRTPEDVPFYHAVYSGYASWFGSAENNDDSPAAFRALQTRELLWGTALGWFLPDILDRPDKIEILRQLCTFRQANLDALAYGTLLDELRFAEPMSSQTYEWLGRRPHYRLFDKNFKLPPSSFATMPDVIGNWWRTDKGEIVLLAANLTDEEQTVQYRPFGATPDAPNATATFAPHELRRI